MFQFKGVYAAMPTLFRADGQINYEENRRLGRFLASNGLHGVLSGGSTGEYIHLTIDERRQLLKEICDELHGKCQIIAHIGSGVLEDTLSLGHSAEKYGADACLVITPSYFQYSFNAVYYYYAELAGRLELPIIVYHYPAATGTFLSPEEILRLSEIPGVVGIKNTEDMNHTAKCATRAKRQEALGGKPFAVASGYDTSLMSVFACGGDAAAGVVENIFPRQTREIYDLIQKNDYTAANKIFLEIMPFVDWMDRGYYPGPVKSALSALGFQAGEPRTPIPHISEELMLELSHMLETTPPKVRP